MINGRIIAFLTKAVDALTGENFVNLSGIAGSNIQHGVQYFN